MTFKPVDRPELAAGEPFTPKIRVAYNGQLVGADTVVRASVVDNSKSKTYCPPVVCTYIAPVPPATEGRWLATFTDTTKLLSKPSDPASKLDSALKDIDQKTGYPTATLQVQIGSPYTPITKDTKITVGKVLWQTPQP
jgi:hypothetical protein